MLPIIALFFAAVSLQAQQTIPLPPRQEINPVLMDEQPIPEESSSDLNGLASNSSLDAPIKDSAPVGNVSLSASGGHLNKLIVLDKEAEVKRLLGLPVFNLQTNKAPLAQVVTLLADACQMNYIGLEKGVGENVQISVNISRNPYEILKLISDRYNVALDYDNGIWRFAIYDDNELIARVYHIRYNDQAEVSGGSTSTGSTGGTTGGSSSSSSGSMAGGSSGATASSFTVKNDVILKDIQTFLSFTSQDPSILTAADFDVMSLTEVTARGISRVLPKTVDSAGSADKGGKVIYNADNKSLYVLATRAQHQWIEKYLRTVDKPQKQILVETKVYETSLNPQTIMGVSLHSASSVDSNGTVSNPLNPNTSSTSTTGPAEGLTAFLSGANLHAAFSMLDSDTKTTTVQYPRQLTISNRPVTMDSTIQTPVVQATTSISAGTSTSSSGTSTSSTNSGSGTATSQSQVQYISTGISISILPRIIDENKILLDISITSSDSVGTTSINGSSYPNISQRDYKTQAIVESGYTLAIGGLKAVTNSDTYDGIPVLSQLPVVGALFRQRTKGSTDTNLMIFISPTILNEYKGGLKDQPQFIAPHDKDYPQKRIFQGSADESYTDIMLSLAGMEHEIQEYAEQGREGLYIDDLKIKIAETENELKLMKVRLQEIALEQPNKNITEADEKIGRYLKDLHELRGSIFKNDSQFSPIL